MDNTASAGSEGGFRRDGVTEAMTLVWSAARMGGPATQPIPSLLQHSMTSA